MKQTVVIDNPPNIEKILAVFPTAKQPGVLFSWGDKIYNPSGYPIPIPLLDHEAVHGYRQGGGDGSGAVLGGDDFTGTGCTTTPELWWKAYLESPEFRLEEELVAHQAEYQSYCKFIKDREQRNRFLHRTALRLSGPLYNRMISYMDARKALQQK